MTHTDLIRFVIKSLVVKILFHKLSHYNKIMISDIEKQLSTPRKLPASSIGPEAKQRYDIVRAFCKKHGIVSTMEFIHPAELAKAPLNMSPKKIRKKIENSRVKQKSVVSLEQEVKDSVKIDIDERRENFK